MKSYKIGVVGATSFVSRFVLQELAKETGEKFLLGARSESKLNSILEESEIENTNFDFISIDIFDRSSLDKMTSQCRLVLNMVGPFDKYAWTLIESCLENNCHYMDITGEFNFVKKVIERYGEEFKNKDLCFLPFCGFDSIPADIGVHYLAEYLSMNKISGCNRMVNYYRLVGGLNGGTYLSALNIFGECETSDLDNSNFFSKTSSPVKNVISAPYKEKNLKNKWSAPFFMEVINQKVVSKSVSERREENLLNSPFRYNERIVLKPLEAFGASLSTSFARHCLPKILKFSQAKNVLAKYGPKSGDGPRGKLIDKGFTQSKIIAFKDDEALAELEFGYAGDPGNKLTAKLMVCAGKFVIKNMTGPRGGVLMPSQALGTAFFDYLRDSEGFTIKAHLLKK